MGIYCQFYFSPLFCLTHAFLFYPEKPFLLLIEFTIAKVFGVGRERGGGEREVEGWRGEYGLSIQLSALFIFLPVFSRAEFYLASCQPNVKE